MWRRCDDHHHADDDQRRRGHLGRHDRRQRRDEHRGEEQHAGHQVRQAGARTLLDARRRTRGRRCSTTPTSPRRRPRRRPRRSAPSAVAGRCPRRRRRPASRDSPVKVPIASKKFANTRVNTSMTAASTPMRPKLSRLNAPTRDRSGRANGEPDSVGTDRLQPPGRSIGRPEMPDRLDDDRDHRARHQPDEDARRAPAGPPECR